MSDFTLVEKALVLVGFIMTGSMVAVAFQSTRLGIEKTRNIVADVKYGIIYLKNPLPGTDTMAIRLELCKNATPGDLIQISFKGGKLFSAKVLEKREPVDDYGII